MKCNACRGTELLAPDPKRSGWMCRWCRTGESRPDATVECNICGLVRSEHEAWCDLDGERVCPRCQDKMRIVPITAPLRTPAEVLAYLRPGPKVVNAKSPWITINPAMPQNSDSSHNSIGSAYRKGARCELELCECGHCQAERASRGFFYTGEVREPKEGEWFVGPDQRITCSMGWDSYSTSYEILEARPSQMMCGE